MELEPFPLAGVSAAYLGELQDELDSTYIKVLVKLIGKNEIQTKAQNRLAEKIGGCLGGGKIKSIVEVCQPVPTPEDSVTLAVIMHVKSAAPSRRSTLSLNGGSSGNLADVAGKIRETLKTTVHRQNAAKRLGEEAELVPFAGFSSLEISQEEEMTTKEVCEVYIKPKTAKSKCSFVGLLAEEDTTNLIGGAGTIVIHDWSSPFKSIYQSLEPAIRARQDDPASAYVWLDVLCISQHNTYTITPRWLTTTLCDAIGTIGSSVLVLANWKRPTVFSRVWCIWELLATIQQGVELTVIMPPEMRVTFDDRIFHDLPMVIKASFDAIDSEHAHASVKHDEMQILASIRDSIGFDGANLVVKDRLLEWVSEVSSVMEKDPKLTSDHLATATFCFRLAKILSAGQGKHAEAEAMLRRAVDIRTVELGPLDDATTEIQVALANVFRVQNKMGEAEATLRRVYESRCQSKGFEHDDTLMALLTLGRVLVDRGTFEDAERVCNDALALAEPKFGLADKRTLDLLVMLSQLADLRMDSDTAAMRLRKALEGFETLFGKDAPQTLSIKTELAGFLAELENFEEAEELYKEASEKLSAALGNGHDYTIKANTGLAVLAKVKESLGPNYQPGRFASKAAVQNIPSTIPEASYSTTATVMGSTATNTDASTVQVTASPPSPQKKISFDPSLTVSAVKSEVADGFSSVRETRHEKIRKTVSTGSKAGASRKHLRGYLEKLPIELSQREKERLARKEASQLLKPTNGAKSGVMASADGRPPKPQGKSMLMRVASSMLPTLKPSDKESKRKSVPNMGNIFSDMNTDVVKMNRVNANWARRFFILQSNQKRSSLVYWENDEDSRSGKDKRGDFPLDDFNTRIFETSPFGPTAFSVSGPKGRIHLKAETPEKKMEWIEVLKDALAFRGAVDKAKILEPNGEVPSALEENRAFFTGSFVNLDSLLGQHSVVLPIGDDLLRKDVLDMEDEQ